MCWVDKYSVEQIVKLRDEYNISTFIETGTFRGQGARLYSFYFKNVLSCDINDDFLKISRSYNQDRNNVIIEKKSSPLFLSEFITEYYRQKRNDIIFIFLDAHFYDSSLMPNEKWVVINELKSLYGFRNCVICIHDFDGGGLGHCCYNGEHLGFPLVLPHLNMVNPNFHYYINTLPFVSAHNEESIKGVKEMIIDDMLIDTLKFVNEKEERKKRGILYCTPSILDLNKYNLRRA